MRQLIRACLTAAPIVALLAIAPAARADCRGMTVASLSAGQVKDYLVAASVAMAVGIGDEHDTRPDR